MTHIPLKRELVEKALRRAYSLGQTYWQQADSESMSQWKKADETVDKFMKLVEETCSAISQPDTEQAEAVEAWSAKMLSNLLARIHRDGGHHEADNGTEPSVRAADAKICAWLARDDATPPSPSEEPTTPAKIGGDNGHPCSSVTYHRGGNYVCQRAGHGVGKDSCCKECPNAPAQPAQAAAPTWPMEQQPDGSVTAVDPADMMTPAQEAAPVVDGGALREAAQAVADFIGGDKDRFGRPDAVATVEMREARERVRLLAVKHGVAGGRKTFLDQCAALLNAVLTSTTPSERPAVLLTDAEIDAAMDGIYRLAYDKQTEYRRALARVIESALLAKIGGGK